jgi:hypothetical protein
MRRRMENGGMEGGEEGAMEGKGKGGGMERMRGEEVTRGGKGRKWRGKGGKRERWKKN